MGGAKVMKGHRIMIIIIGAVIVSLIIAIVVLSILLKTNTQKNDKHFLQQEEAIQALQQTVEALQREDIQRLLEHVKGVMAGEIIIDDKSDPLRRYSYDKDTYPAMDRIVTSLKALEILLDDDIGTMKASYVILYYNSSGSVLRGSSSGPRYPTIWTIEKQGEDWVIVEINERP